METDERTCWYNLTFTEGFGPVGLQKLGLALDERRESVLSLLNMEAPELSENFGFTERIAYAIEQRLRDPLSLPDVMDGIEMVVPGDEHFPNQRFLTANPPLLPVLWCGAERSLLSFTGPTLAIAGSRDAPEAVLEQVYELGVQASRERWLVVSGLAQGVDSAGHQGAIRGGTGTIGVLASGIANASRSWQPEDLEQICVVSQFSPSEPWSGPRAMQRNSTIAGLSDRVVIAASGASGGSWEMGQLCLKRKKPLFVFDLPTEVAEGNQKLIRAGAIPLDPTDPMAGLLAAEFPPESDGEQLRLL